MPDVTTLPWLNIDPGDPTSMHAQIEGQIRLAIADGRLSAGQKLPTVRALAARLNLHRNTVARVYSDLARQGMLDSRRGKGTFVAPAPMQATAWGAGRPGLNSIVTRALSEALSLGLSPSQVEAGMIDSLTRFRAESPSAGFDARPFGEAKAGLVVMGSHDLALDLIGGRLKRMPGAGMRSVHAGSLDGLIALGRGEAHAAGCHLLDEESGEYNLPFVKRVLPGVAVLIVTVVGRIQGLIVPPGNPRRIKSLRDVVESGASFINRQRGAGTRVLLSFLLARERLAPGDLRGPGYEARDHMEVAAAVASGRADAGLGILAAARAFDLDCVPLWNERFDIVIPQASLARPEVGLLLDVLQEADFRESVRALGGYDTSQTGAVVAELNI